MTIHEIRQKARDKTQQEKAQRKARAEQTRKAMKYRAVLNIDITDQVSNEYQRLIAALLQTGWKYLETSALTFEGELTNALIAMELLSKQCHALGTLSALTFHIQGSKDFNGTAYPQAMCYPHASREIRGKSL